MSEERSMTLLEEWINRTVWMDGCDIDAEYRQASEEGRDLTGLEADMKRLIAVPKPAKVWHRAVGGERDEKWLDQVRDVIRRVSRARYRSDNAYEEPSDLAGIRAARSGRSSAFGWEGDHRLWGEKLHGGLLGRICGCMLGKPVEGWDRASIRACAEITGNWPISDYWRRLTLEEQDRLKSRFTRYSVWEGMLKGEIAGMTEDDDINYTTIGFAVVKKYGPNFTPLDMAAFWCAHLPILRTCTAERVAYRNFVSNVLPPDSAEHLNPFREWIGAQIRADYFGYANPGNPERAAEWAWRDACISHTKNGIYGEMWVAAMLAAAYSERDWRSIIRAGMAEIPVKSRLHEGLETILSAYDDGKGFDQAADLIHARWDESREHDWCHTISNAQVVAVGLLYGEDDYETTIGRAVSAGFDTDCNGATCGSLWGVKHGLSALPAKWMAPMRDRLQTGVHGYQEIAISKLAEEMLATAIQSQ